MTFPKIDFSKILPIPTLEEFARKQELCLDEVSADNGRKRTQDDWFKYWSKIKDGRVMASMGDLYTSFKLIKKMRESGTAEEQAIAQRYLNSLREDFDWPGKKNWLVSSTRLIYSGNSLDARIIHHYQSNKPELTKEVTLEVPIYHETNIGDIFNDNKGSVYLQTLLDTEDDAETIISTLEFISGKRRAGITGYTAGWSQASLSDALKQRGRFPNGAAGFDYDDDEFHILGSNNIGCPGCSRGVLVTP